MVTDTPADSVALKNAYPMYYQICYVWLKKLWETGQRADKKAALGHMLRALQIFYKNNNHCPNIDDILANMKCCGFIDEKFVLEKREPEFD